MDNNFMDFESFLNEMPIKKFDRQGDWSPNAKRQYGFNKQDASIIGNEKAVAKIHKKWSNHHYDFDFYFIRSKMAYKHVQVGKVSPEWVKKNLNLDIEPNPDTITVIFTNNTGAEKIPMTAWMLAHRLGHAVVREAIFEDYFSNIIDRDFGEILKHVYRIDKYNSTPQFYEKALKALFTAVGTMKSARQNQLRNSFEFIFELLAQWILDGKIRFNPLPESLVLDRKMAYGVPKPTTRISNDEDRKEYQNFLDNNIDTYEYNIDSVFTGFLGEIFVM